jgi:hypothetical protein
VLGIDGEWKLHGFSTRRVIESRFSCASSLAQRDGALAFGVPMAYVECERA